MSRMFFIKKINVNCSCNYIVNKRKVSTKIRTSLFLSKNRPPTVKRWQHIFYWTWFHCLACKRRRCSSITPGIIIISLYRGLLMRATCILTQWPPPLNTTQNGDYMIMDNPIGQNEWFLRCSDKCRWDAWCPCHIMDMEHKWLTEYLYL